MKLLICIDDRGGMAFNKRRVSRDKNVVADISEYIGDATLFVDSYSAELFLEAGLNMIVSENSLKFSEADDFVFVEREEPSAYMKEASEIVIYKWNRRYPFDVAMKKTPLDFGFKLESVFEFQGNAHDKITREVYKK